MCIQLAAFLKRLADEAAEKKQREHEKALQEVERRREHRLSTNKADKEEDAIKRCCYLHFDDADSITFTCPSMYSN